VSGLAPPPAQPPDQRAAAELASTVVGRLEATEVAASYSVIGGAQAERVSLELGALGAALAERVTISQAAVGGVVAGGDLEAEQTIIGGLVARRVTFRRASGALVLLAGRVDGDVRTVIDWRGALAAGAAAGVVLALLRRRG